MDAAIRELEEKESRASQGETELLRKTRSPSRGRAIANECRTNARGRTGSSPAHPFGSLATISRGRFLGVGEGP